MGTLSSPTPHSPPRHHTLLPDITLAPTDLRMFQLCLLLLLSLHGLGAGPLSQDPEAVPILHSTATLRHILSYPDPPVRMCCSGCFYHRIRQRCVRRGGGRCPC